MRSIEDGGWGVWNGGADYLEGMKSDRNAAGLGVGLCLAVMVFGLGGCANGKAVKEQGDAAGAKADSGPAIPAWELYSKPGTRRLIVTDGDRKGAVVERTLTVTPASTGILATSIGPGPGQGGSTVALQTLTLEYGSGGEVLLKSLIDHGRDEISTFEPPLVLDAKPREKTTEASVSVAPWVDGKEGKVTKRGKARCVYTKASQGGVVSARTELEIDLFPAVVRSVRESVLEAGKLKQTEDFSVKAGPIQVRGYKRTLAEE